MNHSVEIISISPELLEIHWPEKINEGILFEMLAIKKRLAEQWKDSIYRMYQGYQVLGVQLVAGQNSANLLAELKAMVAETYQSEVTPSGFRSWRLPVCYDLRLVPALKNYLDAKSLELESFVKKHTAPGYRLYFYGFLPGFMYLGGLEERLHIPRKAVPDRKISSGSVAIGGRQTGVYPLDSPGGWYVVGKTPVSFFSQGELRVPFRPGDVIRFEPVSLSNYNQLRQNGSLSWEKWEDHG